MILAASVPASMFPGNDPEVKAAVKDNRELVSFYTCQLVLDGLERGLSLAQIGELVDTNPVLRGLTRMDKHPGTSIDLELRMQDDAIYYLNRRGLSDAEGNAITDADMANPDAFFARVVGVRITDSKPPMKIEEFRDIISTTLGINTFIPGTFTQDQLDFLSSARYRMDLLLDPGFEIPYDQTSIERFSSNFIRGMRNIRELQHQLGVLRTDRLLGMIQGEFARGIRALSPEDLEMLNTIDSFYEQRSGLEFIRNTLPAPIIRPDRILVSEDIIVNDQAYRDRLFASSTMSGQRALYREFGDLIEELGY